MSAPFLEGQWQVLAYWMSCEADRRAVLTEVWAVACGRDGGLYFENRLTGTVSAALQLRSQHGVVILMVAEPVVVC